jgi:hypothetical protein
MSVDLDKVAQRIASGRIHTAGKIEFVKDTGPVRRDIRVQGFRYSPDSLRNLAKILWAAQRAHSYSMAALRAFSKMPSSEFSPDGLLGGRGYIQQVKEMRVQLGQAVEVLSSFTDTVHDEINAEHWAGAPEVPAVQELVNDADQVKANPEEFVENSFDNEGFEASNPAPMNPTVEETETSEEGAEGEDEEEEEESGIPRTSAEEPKKKEKKDPRSGLPGDGKMQGEAKTAPEIIMNTTTPEHGNYASAIHKILKSQESRVASNRFADSSLPVDTLPGPRVDHIGPAAGNEAGHFNHEDVWPSDDPNGEGLWSGTNMTRPVYEEWTMDGVTGDDNATDGDETVLKVDSLAAKIAATYSWLPGANNSKNLDYYALGLSTEDMEWMKKHSDPDPPKGFGPPKPKDNSDWLWDPDLR